MNINIIRKPFKIRPLIEKTIDETGRVSYTLNLENILIPLQVLFLILKFTGVVSWGWGKVLIPGIIMIVWTLFFFLLGLAVMAFVKHNDPMYQLTKILKDKKKKDND